MADIHGAKYFLANFKMYFSFARMQQFVKEHKKDLIDLASLQYVKFGIAAGHDQLYYLEKNFKQSEVMIGAQSCSSFLPGPYTGQVSVQSFIDLSLKFCIVGHNESRYHQADTNVMIAAKVKMLLAAGIMPVICIGDTAEQKADDLTLQTLYDQLEFILEVIRLYPEAKIAIAYEPVYAIGTGNIPEQEDIANVFSFLRELLHEVTFAKNVMFLYGGSVTSTTVHELRIIEGIDGFLIGSASQDYQELKKIVLSEYKVVAESQLEQLQIRN